jgi:hypothetical protein
MPSVLQRHIELEEGSSAQGTRGARPFVGRERELAELDALLTYASQARGALCLITGEPGIGKTLLAAEAATTARTYGLRATWGRCWEAGGAPAYWPWREALGGLGLEFPQSKTVSTLDPAEARFALFREVTSELASAAARQPLLIVLEDLHAADRSTLLLLEFVAGQVRTLPLLILGTYRDLELKLQPELSEGIARLGAGHVLALPRFQAAEVSTLVRAAIDGADEQLAEAVYRTTDGNPLFVEEYVRDVRARSSVVGSSIPLGVREVIRQRLELFSGSARTVLEAAAVLGVEFGTAEVSRMVDGAGPVLEDARSYGLLLGGSGRLHFAHALYREALYYELPCASREALHRDAARTLTTSGAPLAEVAHHLLLGGPSVAPQAITQAIRAAEHALGVFAFEDATALLEQARAAIPHGALERPLLGQVLIATGEARLRGGDASGRALCVEAAQIARELDDANLLARAALAYGAVFTTLWVDPTLVGMLEEAERRLPVEDSAMRARIMARLAAARQPSSAELRPRDLALALDAVAMARRVAEPRDRLEVLHSASGALYGAADPRVRLLNSREQEALALELGDTTRLLQARSRIAMDLVEIGDFAAYRRLADDYEQVAARVGRAAAPWRVPLMRSMCALVSDQFEESERQQQEARRIESERRAARRAQILHHICFLRAAERHTELRAHIPVLRSVWLELHYGVVLAEPRVASVLARIGADDEVRALVESFPELVFREQINSPPLAEALWLVGNATQASMLLATMGWLENRWQTYWLDVEIVEGPSSRLFALLSGVAGDWNEADRQLERALREIESVGRRSLAARLRFEFADLLVRAGREPERARLLLSTARASAEAVGLPELVALIERRHPQRPAPEAMRRAAFAITLEGEYYTIEGTRTTLRFKATRGMHYLAQLVERAGVEIHVLELASASDHPDRGDAGELLDAAAFRACREKLEALRDAAENATALGDGEAAQRARAEMEAIASELARASGPGGRPRRGESAVDRARSAVQRRIKDAIDRIAEQDPELGQGLRQAVRTGNYCSYRRAQR